MKMQSGPGHVTRDFHHPYLPYSIQETFMEAVYQVLETKSVGILESPTGTGKSLSLICGALTWLRDHKSRVFEETLECGDSSTGEPEWIIEQTKARKRREFIHQRERLEAKLAKIRAKEKYQPNKKSKEERAFKRRKAGYENDDDLMDEDQFVLDEYESDHDQNGSKKVSGCLFSAETLKLLDQIGMGPALRKEDDEEEMEDQTKIFFCSRTHSQLTQFINELRRPKFPPSIIEKETKNVDFDEIKHLTLGSRKNLCINPKVNKLGSLAAINERCAELQQSSTAKAEKCCFMPNKENQPLVNSFRDHALATIRDIEDMGALGREIKKSAREALGISLKGHVVIIDEAHNLMDAISAINSVEVNVGQLKLARQQLGEYLKRFRNKLKGKNRVYVAQVVRVIDSLIGYLESQLAGSKMDGIVSENDLLAGNGVDQINLFKLAHYLQESKLARKVESYGTHKKLFESSKAKSSGSLLPKPEATTPVIHHLVSLLLALTHPQNEGRFFFSKNPPDNITLRFLLLDPSTQFREVVSSARAVVLAGGTMSPMTDYTRHLFPYLEESKIITLSCGHVIPKENLIVWNLSKGPTGQEYEFTFKNRGNNNMIEELGRAILNICTIIPDGVVVFFPSYSYLTSIVAHWSQVPPDGPSLLQRLEAKKHVFQESKDVSVDKILQDYASAIDSLRGGLLLSVVGGKMSEGINFSDALGRCVIIVGLPFPNINSAEWKAKIEYVEKICTERLKAGGAAGTKDSENVSKLSREEMVKRAKELGRDFYENACMRAVNQSVGRAIRHKGDYAAIFMVDKRFESERVKRKLPGWIQESLVSNAGEKNFGTFMGAVSTFFRAKKNT